MHIRTYITYACSYMCIYVHVFVIPLVTCQICQWLSKKTELAIQMGVQQPLWLQILFRDY